MHSGERLEDLGEIVEGGGLLELLLNTSCCHLFQADAGNSKIKFKREYKDACSSADIPSATD